MEKGKVDIEQIKRYVRGELSPREMYALERQAESDPMLMDIIRGMEEAPLEQHTDNLADIHGRVAARIGQQASSTPPVRRLAPARRWAIAASILAVLSVGTWWFMRDSTAPEQATELALAPPPPPAAKRSIAAEAEVETEAEAEAATTAEAPLAAAAEPVVAEPVVAEPVAVPEASLSARLAEADVADSGAAALGYDSGQQLAAKSVARPTVGALTRSSAIRAATPVDSLPKDTEARAEIASATEVPSAKEIAEKQGSPTPAGGWPAYLEYLNNALKPATGKGTVQLEFTVGADGSPTNINVVESADAQLNPLATLVVRDGPRWLPGGDGARKVVLTIRF